MRENMESYEKEINLQEIVFYCLKKWRWFVAWMVLVALFVGGIKVTKTVCANQDKLKIQKMKGVVSVEKTEDLVLNPRVAYYEKAVAEMEREMVLQDQYMQNSMIMQMDPYCLQTAVLTFHIEIPEDENEANALDVLVDSYSAYVIDGRLAQELTKKAGGGLLSDMQYLLSVSNNYSRVSVISDGEQTQWPKQCVLQVTLVALNEAHIEMYMEIAEAAIKSYSEELMSKILEHEINLLATTKSERMDSDIQNYQIEVLNSYTSSAQKLNDLKAQLKDIKNEEGEVIKFESDVLALENPIVTGIKFCVIGAILGACIAGAVIIIYYILSKKLLNIDCFEKEYGVCLLGRFCENKEKNRRIGLVDRWIQQMEEGEYAKVDPKERNRIVVSNIKSIIMGTQGITKVMLAGTISNVVAESVCEQLKQEIPEKLFSDYKQLLFSIDAMEALNEYDAVLFIEKEAVSEKKLILEECYVTKQRNAKILGVIIINAK